MSLMGAYADGISGMLAFSEAMGSVSTNIANTRTVGYKLTDTEFSTLLGGNQISGEEQGGVQAWTRNLVDLQGPIEQTQGPFDLAISGEGFFLFGDTPVAGGGSISYSRAGDFVPQVSPDDPLTSYIASNNGRYLLAWPADAQGNFAMGDASSLVPISASRQTAFPGQATTEAKLVAAIPATGETTNTSLAYFAETGDPAEIQQLNANLTFTQTAPLTWTLDVTDDNDAALAGPFTVTFDGTGKLTSASELDIGGIFTLDISELQQLGPQFERVLYTQDGLAPGEFESLDFTADGTVFGRYTSGAVVPLYRIPVALFAAPNNLTSESANFYLESAESGAAELRAPGDSLVRLQPHAVENSNVDLGDAFTRMIITQRAYNSAAQVVRTCDEMSQTIRDLKR
jgi:flagellar hook protein FlgE